MKPNPLILLITIILLQTRLITASSANRISSTSKQSITEFLFTQNIPANFIKIVK